MNRMKLSTGRRRSLALAFAGAATVALLMSCAHAAAPTVTSVTPNMGSIAGGDPIVLTGTGFTGATAVQFGVTPAASYTVDSDTQITCTSPSEPPGTVDIR